MHAHTYTHTCTCTRADTHACARARPRPTHARLRPTPLQVARASRQASEEALSSAPSGPTDKAPPSPEPSQGVPDALAESEPPAEVGWVKV